MKDFDPSKQQFLGTDHDNAFPSFVSFPVLNADHQNEFEGICLFSTAASNLYIFFLASECGRFVACAVETSLLGVEFFLYEFLFVPPPPPLLYA